MSARVIVEAVLLSLVVLSCWIGCIGMLRMREPMQALHYISLPACAGSVCLVIAVFLRTGNSQAAWKSVLICFVLLATNSVVAHATARAFRTRELGHWEPHAEDGVERLPAKQEQRA